MAENEGVFKLRRSNLQPVMNWHSSFRLKAPLVAQVNAALAAMKADGTLDTLNKKWGLIQVITKQAVSDFGEMGWNSPISPIINSRWSNRWKNQVNSPLRV